MKFSKSTKDDSLNELRSAKKLDVTTTFNKNIENQTKS